MKKIVYIIILLIGFWGNSQTPQPTGTRYNNATKSDTISGKTRIPVLDANNVLNKYTVVDSLPLNAPLTSSADSLLIYTPQKRAAHIPFSDFLQKLKTSLDTIYNVAETDPIFNAWDKDYNDLINTPEYSNFAFTAPYLRELVPDTYLPSTTGNFILRGSFFTPDMEITIEGHTINYQTFVSSNEFIVNLTTSATEGLYDVTLNNGLIAVFPDQLQVINGTVYQPINAEWINTSGNITLDNENLRLLVDGSLGSTEWNRTFDITKDFQIYFTRKFSPIAANGDFHSVDLVTFTDLTTSDEYIIRSVYGSGGQGRFYILKNETSLYNIIYGLNTDTNVIKLTFNESTNVMSVYIDNVLRYSFADTEFANDFNSVWNVQWYYDILDIKYIDLSDTSGDLQNPINDYAKNIALDVTDFDNNLDETITDVQKLADAVDELSLGGGGGSDDQTASEVPFTPYSTIAATNVQDAIEEVLDEIPTSLAAANITVSPSIGGNTDAYAVMDDHEDRIAALETVPKTEVIQIAASDLVTNITTGTSKAYFRMPYAMTLTEVRVSLLTAGTTTGITVDINENGASILSTKLTTDATEKTSTTATTPAIIGDNSLADDSEITIDFDAVPSGGRGVIVTLIGTR